MSTSRELARWFIHAPGLPTPGMVQRAAVHGLGPAMWSRGVAAGCFRPLPDDVVRVIVDRDPDRVPIEIALQRAYDDNVARTAALLDQGDELLDGLAAAGVPARPLKGWWHLRSGWWPDPAARVMRDLDVLVAPDAATTAHEVCRSLGYVDDPVGFDPAVADHQLAPMVRGDAPASVEIHTATAVRRWAGVLPAARLLEGSPSSLTDAVSLVIIHTQLHDEGALLGHVPLRALHEVWTLASGPHGTEIDWSEIRGRFEAHGCGRPLDVFLAQLGVVFGGVAVPPRRVGGRLTAHLTLLLDDHARLSSIYRQVAFAPRALGAERMTALHPGLPVWRARARHLGRGARRRVDRRLRGEDTLRAGLLSGHE